MENEKLLQQMRTLVDTLNAASDAYYNGRGEVMTDYEWDAAFDELKKLEEESGTILEDSPTMNVSKDTITGEKEPHEFAALSLAKTKKPEELVKWASGKEIWLSWKLDGLTLVATYDNGKLTKIVTRGDGHVGTNITHIASSLYGVLPTIKDKGHVVIRGEAIISYKDFNAFLMESGEDYANPRNLASGSLTLKDTDEIKRRNIHWIPFTLVHSDQEFTSWGEQMKYLKDLGFDCVESECITEPTLGNVNEVIRKWTLRVTNEENPYPVDGLVITYDDIAYARGGSVTGHHATRAGYAFKWQDEAVQSTLDHIEWSCAASTITPVAIFEPVEIEGTTVKRASLCNISECERLGIGDQGTLLSIIKANKIIPKVVSVQKIEGTLHIPSECPVCHSPTEIVTSKKSLTKTLHCTNESCPAKQLKKYTRFVSKAGMDIEGISEATLFRFINEGWVHNCADIYRLSDYRDQIAQLDGFGEKSADNINASLTKAKTVSDQKLLFALNIPLVGQDVSRRLLSRYSIHELVQLAQDTEDYEVFASIEGIGPEKSAAFVRYFHDEENVSAWKDLLTQITITESEKSASGSLCEGLTFVITGDVHHYKNRNELKAYIMSQGGKVTGSVSKSTNYLINNDLESTSSKNTKAKSLNIPIISEDMFIEQFTQGE